MFSDLESDYKDLSKEIEEFKSINQDYEKLITELKEDNKNLRLHTELNVKETKSIKCQTEKWLMSKSINYNEIELSPDKINRSNQSILKKTNSASTIFTNTNNSNSILKKEKSIEKSNTKNESFLEFRNEIMTVLNEFKQYPEKIKEDLKIEILNKFNSMTNLSTYDQNNTINTEYDKNFANPSPFKNNTKTTNSLYNYHSPTFSSLSRDNNTPNYNINSSKLLDTTHQSLQFNNNNNNFQQPYSNAQINPNPSTYPSNVKLNLNISNVHDNNKTIEGFTNSIISNNTKDYNNNYQMYEKTRDVNVYMNNIKNSI